MIYLESFNDYNINEKVSWKDLFFYSLIFLTGYSNYKDYKKINNLYSEINSPDSRPSIEEKELLESIRQKLINDVKDSSKWNKFGKDKLLDSLKVVEFRIVDSIDYENKISKNSSACFINLDNLKSSTSFFLKKVVKEPSQNNIIVVRRDALKYDHFEDILIHELYHYLDKLLALNNDFSKFIDTDVKDKHYASKKFAFILKSFAESKDRSKEQIKSFKLYYDDGKLGDLYEISKDLIDPWLKEYDYYSSPDELFARWWTLKSDMKQKGIIKNIEDRITLEDISDYLKKGAGDDSYDIIMILDWDKLEDFQNYIES